MPTQVQHQTQGSNTHTSSNRNPGDLLTNSVFDTGDIVNPTPVGVGRNARTRMRNGSGGGGGDDNDPDPRNNDNRDPNRRPSDFSRRGSNGPGRNDPPGGPGSNPPSGGYPGSDYWGTGVPFPG